jgi:1,4-alpha-glucan branching enzyme
MARTARTKSKQSFTFKAPEARSVLLLADFTRWQEQPVLMKKRKAGDWTATVSLPPGTYHYRFLVDGAWRDDPECILRVPNPFGTENMVRKVS